MVGDLSPFKTIWLMEGRHNDGQQHVGIQNPVLNSVMPKRNLTRRSSCTKEGVKEATARGSFVTAMPGVSLRVPVLGECMVC